MFGILAVASHVNSLRSEKQGWESICAPALLIGLFKRSVLSEEADRYS